MTGRRSETVGNDVIQGGIPGAWAASPDLPDMEDSICVRAASCSGVASKFALEGAVVVDLLVKGQKRRIEICEVKRGTYEDAAG